LFYIQFNTNIKYLNFGPRKNIITVQFHSCNVWPVLPLNLILHFAVLLPVISLRYHNLSYRDLTICFLNCVLFLLLRLQYNLYIVFY
jgi:hypothetical protein